ncbi:hypothetical protein [Coxiella-like endosymbiont]|uniref:hypothetical protein n=1 Tax=Coxiella-like endosymbiont TaxID=1592897 RepID=UPI00272B4716|nr:hypothetical protein [Coxiella-like endosymbiont]
MAQALQPEISVDSYVVSERAIAFDGLINFYTNSNTDDNLTQNLKNHFYSLTVIDNFYATRSYTFVAKFIF